MAALTRDAANYISELITVGGGIANPTAPLFDLCAGVGNLRRQKGMAIAMSVLSTSSNATQAVITEAASGAAITATNYATSQLSNIMQIMQRTVDVTAVKEAASDEIEGVSLLGQPVIMNGIDLQLMKALEDIKMDIEFSLINGTYVADGGSAVASSTTGLLEAITASIETAGDADITKAFLNSLLTKMSSAGAKFINPIILCGDREQIILNDLYGFATQSNVVGGTNVSKIWTSKGLFQVVYEPMMPAGSLVVADLAYLKPTFMPLPVTIGSGEIINVGNLASGLDVAVYNKSSGGASIARIVQTVMGLNYGNEALHGKITGLKTT